VTVFDVRGCSDSESESSLVGGVLLALVVLSSSVSFLSLVLSWSRRRRCQPLADLDFDFFFPFCVPVQGRDMPSEGRDLLSSLAENAWRYMP